MIYEERDSFDVVLFVGLTGDEEMKLRVGNPTSVCISCDCEALTAADRCDAGFRTFSDYQHASKRVDLVIFGSSTSATAFNLVISRFAQDDAVIVVPPSASITAKDLSAAGCGDGRLLTLRRIGEVQVVGYEVGGDFGTRVSAKLMSEFVEPLGRVVFGAELRVSGVFKKPETLVGSYFIVALEGAKFPWQACRGESDLVAVDLSNSRMREFADGVFERCGRLAAVAFPAELVNSGWQTFWCCTALTTVDLASTAVEKIDALSFAWSGLVRMSFPTSLRRLRVSALNGTPLAVLDLSMSADVTVKCDMHGQGLDVTELRLPQKGFAELAAALLRDSRVRVLYADVDMADIEQLLLRRNECAIDRPRVVSPRLGEPFEWVRSTEVTDPALLGVAPTFWGQVPKDQLRFVRSIDLSALGELHASETLSNLSFLESVILPARIRVVSVSYFQYCWRLSHVGTTDCVVLEEIGWNAFLACRNLREFVFPVTVRKVGSAFAGTSIVRLDLSETRAESLDAQGMKFLERLVLPRRCVLKSALGLPALRSVTFGVCGDETRWSPREVRFESLTAPAKGGPLAVGARAFGEVACVLGRESFPFPP
jgi:hypothetical protein